jgi:uncharacterized protein (DUF305 family)
MTADLHDQPLTSEGDSEPPDAIDGPDESGRGPGSGAVLRMVLTAVALVAALVAAGAIGWLVRGDGGSSAASATSVDAGFARDMSTHHTQAVIMAGYTRDHTTDPAIRNLAYDIEYAQNQQIGEMTGWLDGWGLTRSSSVAVMSWMSDDGHAMHMDTASTSSSEDPGDVSLMPGMATPNEVTKLETMTGRSLDVYFLQLMLRHHIGGIEMAQYAATHAKFAYVRNLAQKMVDNQTAEITVMKTMLTQRGAQPLP